MKIRKKLVIIVLLCLIIIPHISFAFDDKLGKYPTWRNEDDEINIENIITTREYSALFNNESKNYSDVNTDSGFAETAAESILWINKYTHKKKIDYTELSGDINDDSYKVIKAALEKYLSKSNISSMNSDVLLGYDEFTNSNSYDVNSGNDSVGINEEKYLYPGIIAKNYYEVSKQARETIQEMTAAAGYAKAIGHEVKTKTKYKASDGNNIDFTDSYDTKHSYTKAQIEKYIDVYGVRLGEEGENRKKLLCQWASMITDGKWITDDKEAENILNELNAKKIDEQVKDMTGYTIDQLNRFSEENAKLITDGNTDDPDATTIFRQPKRDTDKDVTGDVIKDADSFIESGKDVGDEDGYIDETQLQNFSQTLYSILFGIGVAIAVIVGMIIGIKLMIAPIGERAEAKKLLIPYVVGCVIVFGAFGIWQLAVTIMQGF